MVCVSLRKETELTYFLPQNSQLSANRSNHSRLLRWKNLPQISPSLRRELTKKKGRGTMSTTPHGLPLCLLAGWRKGFSYATMKRRVVLWVVKAAATSGMALRSAAVSNLEVVTAFQVILYSPARSSSRWPIAALMASFRASTSAWASSTMAYI